VFANRNFPMRNLTINAERLWRELMETAAIGATPKGEFAG